ncbi:MAG: TIGR00366 family protein [Ignavibacteriales bacterium]|nr:TIGR00366 family protein [Ignavibacteriales bacterium]
MKKNFSFNTLVMIYAIVVLVAIMTWVIPGGEYKREIKDNRNIVVPNSFTYIQSEPQGLGAVLQAPIKGFVSASEIIVFLFVIGGSFMIIQRTGAVTSALQRVAETLADKPHLQKYFIPATMVLFSIGGSTFGMCEETMPFVLIFIPLALSLGYDSIVGTAIPFLGAAAGFAGATLNPFTLGIALKISELPYDTALWYRIIIWIISTTSMITFVMIYASKIKKKPEKSLVYEIDKQRKHSFHLDNNSKTEFTKSQKYVLLAFAAALVVMVIGILEYNWFIVEIAALFFALGIIAGLIGKLKLNEITESFKEGAKDMVGVALIIACARAMLVVATDAKIIDTMLFGMANVISNFHPVVAAQSMFVTQGIINFFVHSGSGQAALTMPVMSPLADVLGIPRFVAVLAFQFGEGWINPILPTSGVTMGVLGLAGISWDKWFKWMLPIQIFFLILALLLIIPPFFFRY